VCARCGRSVISQENGEASFFPRRLILPAPQNQNPRDHFANIGNARAVFRLPPVGLPAYGPSVMSNYALILAGGSGTRFWPLSRNEKPKQLLNLFGDASLLEQTIRRLDGLVPTENIIILTNSVQEAAVREIASMLPPENIFAEPVKRDTAPAVALGIGIIAARAPSASMIVLPSDQLISDTAAFQEVMRDALTTAEKSGGLVTIGIRPTWPCPSYGYIERGPKASIAGLQVHHAPYDVIRFREKPSPELAEQFISRGGFCWNAGMFVWSVPAVLRQLAKHTPELGSFISELLHSSNFNATVAAQFPKLPPISIDYALMEKADRVFNLEASFDWDDVGSWISVARHLTSSGNNNRTNAPVSEIDSQNNIIFNTRKNSHVALLGVDDLIIVQTEDALLIANRHQADAIRKLTDRLPKELL
jgi:mannose-1-phosphate guanylyltransferase